MARLRSLAAAAAGLVLVVAGGDSRPDEPFTRYRVEQTIRLETASAPAQPARGIGGAAPTNTTTVEARVRWILEQRLRPDTVGEGTWRFTEVKVEGPQVEPAEASNPGVERALALGLEWIRKQEGREFAGALAELPVVPLGEAEPAWLAAWLRWAQTGIFSGAEKSPVSLPGGAGEGTSAIYEVRWLRTEARQVLCTVQQARWTVPVRPAMESVAPALAAQGVEARTHFAAQSLEWVSQQNPTLVYAERSGVRETFWNLEKVSQPDLRQMVFRLRFAVEVRVERLP
ncbi:MAG: hypothetical protein ACE5IP_07015 [Terriglobia bacterium]